MDLNKAVEILKIKQAVAELDISNGTCNLHTREFVDAVEVVIKIISNAKPNKY